MVNKCVAIRSIDQNWNNFKPKLVESCNVASSSQSNVYEQLLQPHQKSIQSLCDAIRKRMKDADSTKYMEFEPIRIQAFKKIKSKLKKEASPLEAELDRKPELLHFCRMLIPSASHPFIKYMYKTNDLLKNKLDGLYDAFTVIVMLNTLIDDSADVLKLESVIKASGQIHCMDDHVSLMKGLTCEEVDIITGMLKLWDQACKIIEELFEVRNIQSNPKFEQLVFPEMIRINDVMQYSIKRSEGRFGQFDEALRQYEVGMIIHLFWKIEECIMTITEWGKPVMEEINENPTIKDILSQVDLSNSICSRVANDMATFNREIGQQLHTNSGAHALQEKIDAEKMDFELHLNTDKKDYIMQLYHSFEIDEKLLKIFMHHIKFMRDASYKMKKLETTHSDQLASGIDLLIEGKYHLLGTYMQLKTQL